MHNVKRLIKNESRCTLRMHPEDAARLGLDANVSQVSVSSGTGVIVADLEISQEMMPGVVSLPHGWGHHREGVRLSVASQRPGVSLNDITEEGHIDALTGTIAFSGVAV